jgi:hypothetical protein
MVHRSAEDEAKIEVVAARIGATGPRNSLATVSPDRASAIPPV